ncbi:MAG TPA: histidine kinase [Bryobacteraceae bacterium]|nr:histidine kinase [Bryobacteraceae bacterium]
MSRLLHDDVSQVLSAVGLQLDALRMDFREAAPDVEGRAGEIQELLEQAIEQLRDISNELNPSIVERAGLHFALDRLTGKVRRNFPGTLRLHFDPATRIPTVLANTFYKIAECALENATARPGCSMIDIQVKQARGEYVLQITGNGEQGEVEEAEASMSRLLMDYHASKSHVLLKTENVPGKGTVLRASFPVPSTPIPGGAQ